MSDRHRPQVLSRDELLARAGEFLALAEAAATDQVREALFKLADKYQALAQGKGRIG
jgi:hypothetical protein